MPSRARESETRYEFLYALQQEKVWRLKMRVFLGLALAAAIAVGGVYAVAGSVKNPAVAGTYEAYTSGAASRIDWSDRINAGFDE
jgi:hypothetical protein